MAGATEVRRAGTRYVTLTDWLDSRHSFSYGSHYDPANTGFGLLLVNNEDRIAAGAGFANHPHRDMEIVTWVLEGSLVHQDSQGNRGVIRPGVAQRMSAGSGITHSERNDAETCGRDGEGRAVHLVQMWVAPDEPGGAPGYEQLDVEDQLAAGDLVMVATGMPTYRDSAAIRIDNGSVALQAARLAAGRSVELADAPYVHLFLARGAADLEGAGALAQGDAARILSSEGRRITAGADGAEILCWQMHPSRTHPLPWDVR